MRQVDVASGAHTVINKGKLHIGITPSSGQRAQGESGSKERFRGDDLIGLNGLDVESDTIVRQERARGCTF
jgi:hypothetical protein